MRERRRASSGGKWEPIVGYSRAVRVGDTVWVSGCSGAGPGGTFDTTDPYEQAKNALETMRKALEDLGLSMAHVVKTGVYLANMDHWEAVARAHREAFGEIRPACLWVEGGKMVHPVRQKEIHAI
jgi:enamine deaminase RidA (YjgF/YER057c/UK114 family)